MENEEVLGICFINKYLMRRFCKPAVVLTFGSLQFQSFSADIYQRSVSSLIANFFCFSLSLLYQSINHLANTTPGERLSVQDAQTQGGSRHHNEELTYGAHLGEIIDC